MAYRVFTIPIGSPQPKARARESPPSPGVTPRRGPVASEQAKTIHSLALRAGKVRWRKNPGRAKRTIAEAIAIARRQGVRIPADVVFFEAEPGELKGSFRDLFAGKGMATARGPTVSEAPDGTTEWKDGDNR